MMKTVFLISFLLASAFPVFASDPLIWTINSREEVLKGQSDGVSVSDDGSIGMSPNLEQLADTGQPFVWSSALDKAGNHYLGTGSEGRIFKVGADGSMSLLADLEELNVTALAVAPNGDLFAGTSPDGRVYRIKPDGSSSMFFEPGEKYIWALAVLKDGSLAVATGENGRIYKVTAANADAEGSVLFDSSDTHIISLAADPNGGVYAGTDPAGLVIRVSPDGRAFGILDSPLREIHEIVVGVDGSVYVLALGESASTAESGGEGGESKKKNSVTIPGKKGMMPAASEPAKSRYDLSGSRSAVYRIKPEGGTDVIWNSREITAFSVYAHLTGAGVLIGTSDKGRIYSVSNSGRERLTLETGEGQISGIWTDERMLYASSSNLGKLFRFGGPREKAAKYSSPVLDAGGTASWGRIWWRSTGNVSIRTRSGNTENPDETWSGWQSPNGDGTSGQIASPSAKFIQWEATLSPGGPDGPRLNEVSVSLLPANIAPEILSIDVLPPNIGLAPNPSVPIDPNIETSGMDPSDFGIILPPPAPRKLYQRGAKSLIWKAEDRNGDDLAYSIYFKEVSESEFKLLERNLDAPFFTIDGLAFADGRYVFKVIVSDLPSNPSARSLQGELTSEPFEIDNTAPTVTAGAVTGSGGRFTLAFTAEDSSSYVRRAEYSINGGNWRTVYADDGISDSKRESFTVEISLDEPGEYSIALRVYDSVGNTGSARTVVRR